MARALTTITKDTRSYIPTDWLADDKDQLTFEYTPLSKRALAKVADSSTKMDLQTNTLLVGNAEVSMKILAEAVTNIKNLIVDDKAVKYKTGANGAVADSIMEMLPLDIIEEVSKQILYVSKFGDDDKEQL